MIFTAVIFLQATDEFSFDTRNNGRNGPTASLKETADPDPQS